MKTEEEIEEESETEEEIEKESEAQEIEENADMAISNDSVINWPSPPVVKKPTRGGNAGKYKRILLIIHILSCYL